MNKKIKGNTESKLPSSEAEVLILTITVDNNLIQATTFLSVSTI